MALLAMGLVALPFASKATTVGILEAKWPASQIFGLPDSFVAPSCEVEADTFAEVQVTSEELGLPFSSASSADVIFEEGWTLGLSFDELNVGPWSIHLYSADNEELRYSSELTSWVTESDLAADVVAENNGDEGSSSQTSRGTVPFSQLLTFGAGAEILLASQEGVVLQSQVDGIAKTILLANAQGQESGLTLLPDSNFNSCVSGVASGDDVAILSTYEVTSGESIGAIPMMMSAQVETEDRILGNAYLRFGHFDKSGEDSQTNSITNKGNLSQPFYYNGVRRDWYKLTFSSYALNMAFGSGTGNSSNWTGTTVADIDSLSPVSQSIDWDGWVRTSADTDPEAYGHGVVIVDTVFTLTNQRINVRNKYTLGETASFVKIETTVTNLDDDPLLNFHIWTGTRDDFVAVTDGPLKYRGNITSSGDFEISPTRTSQASALLVTSKPRESPDGDAVLFYSTTPGTNMIVDSCCGFDNVFGQDPSVGPNVSVDSPPYDLTRWDPNGYGQGIGYSFDGSYGLVLPMGNISSDESKTITWFYAGGSTGDLDTVAQAVAGAASNAPTVSRSGSNVAVSWTAPDAGAGREVTGYQYRYYSEVDSNNDPIWIESSVLPSSQLSASLSGLSSSTAHNFQVRTITGAEGGGEPQTGDWSSTATLAAVPAWNPSSRSLTGPVATPFSSTIETNNATGLSLGAGATVTVTGLPTGVSANVLRASTANQFPAVELSGTPTVAGTYTVTITITDSAGNIVTSDFTFTVTSGSSGSFSAPPQMVSPTPASRPNAPRPRPTPSPTPVATVPLGPVALLERRDPTPNVRFDNPTQIPRDLVDVLDRPLGYTVEQTTGAPVLPQLTPSESLAYENGSPVVIQLVRTDEDNGYALIGDGWQVNLEAADSAGSPLRLDDSGNIILNQDRFVQFSGTGFAPGSIVKVWLFSDPAEISEIVADANGNFVGQAQLPEGIPTGEHTVQLNGLTKDGQLRSVSLGVVVQPDLVVPPVASVGFDLTGLLNFLWLLAAGVLIWFFIVWRRRKKKEEEGEIPNNSGVEELPIFASEGFEPSQQFPNDSRRRIGAAAPPTRKRFTFKPKGA